MWLSKMLSKSDKTMTAESGSVTLSDKNTCEIGASVCQRDIDSYSPTVAAFTQTPSMAPSACLA